MRLGEPTRRMFISVGAALGVVTLAGATLAWRTVDASAASPTYVAVTQQATSEPAPPSTPSPSTSSSTSTSTSTSTTSTSTTVRPRPVTTTTRVTVASPVTAPPVTRPAPAALPTDDPPAERCATARQWVAEHGVVLPAGWGFRCPGQATVAGADRWGLACWNCNGDGTSWIAVDIGRIGPSDATLRYVVAHETCHAIDYMGLGITTEIGADLCAALHGAPRP